MCGLVGLAVCLSRCVVVAEVLDLFFEDLHGLPNAARKIREFLCTEQQQQNKDENKPVRRLGKTWHRVLLGWWGVQLS